MSEIFSEQQRSIRPKPAQWRLITDENKTVEFIGVIPAKWKRRFLARCFGWRVQLRQISGEYIDA
jgi:hypothetical protein